jgi:predicted negative regulator of RcsB-dependent stress response
LLAEGKTGEASAALVVAAGSAYQSILLETQGDIAAAEGKATEARKLYAQAMELSDAQRKTVIKLKFDDLATGEGV